MTVNNFLIDELCIYSSNALLICINDYSDELIHTLIKTLSLNKNLKIYILVQNITSKKIFNYCELFNNKLFNIISQHDIYIRENISLDMSALFFNNTYISYYNNENKQVTEDNEIKYFIHKFIDLFNDARIINSDINNIYKEYIAFSNDLNTQVINYISSHDNIKYQHENFLYLNSFKIKFNSSDVPQYSNFIRGTIELTNLIDDYNNIGLTYLEIGKGLLEPNKNIGAYTKYGENHAKLSESLSLVYITNENNVKKVYLTTIGKYFLKLCQNEQINFLKFQIYNIPLIKLIFNLCLNSKINIEDLLSYITDLSQSTIKRRSSSIKNLIKFLIADSPISIKDTLSNSLLKSDSNIDYKNILSINLENLDELYNTINKKLLVNRFLHIDLLYKIFKLNFPDLSKQYNILNKNDLKSFIDDFSTYHEFKINNDIVCYKDTLYSNPIDYYLQTFKIVNRNDLFLFLKNIGYTNSKISNMFIKSSYSLVRLDHENYKLLSNLKLPSDEISKIENIISNLLKNTEYISLLDLDILSNFVINNSKYEYTSYLLNSIINNYMYNKFRIISKHSNITFTYHYLLVVKKESTINSFSDLIVNITSNYFTNNDYIKYNELENYLYVNNIIKSGLHKNFLDDKFTIDKLDRIHINKII